MATPITIKYVVQSHAEPIHASERLLSLSLCVSVFVPKQQVVN